MTTDDEIVLPECNAENGFANSPDHQTLWDWVDSDRCPHDRNELTELLCILHSVVSMSGVTEFPSVPADCFCGKTTLHTWQNAGQSVRYIARAVRAQLERDQAAGVVRVH